MSVAPTIRRSEDYKKNGIWINRDPKISELNCGGGGGKTKMDCNSFSVLRLEGNGHGSWDALRMSEYDVCCDVAVDVALMRIELSFFHILRERAKVLDCLCTFKEESPHGRGYGKTHCTLVNLTRQLRPFEH